MTKTFIWCDSGRNVCKHSPTSFLNLSLCPSNKWPNEPHQYLQDNCRFSDLEHCGKHLGCCTYTTQQVYDPGLVIFENSNTLYLKWRSCQHMQNGWHFLIFIPAPQRVCTRHSRTNCSLTKICICTFHFYVPACYKLAAKGTKNKTVMPASATENETVFTYVTHLHFPPNLTHEADVMCLQDYTLT